MYLLRIKNQLIRKTILQSWQKKYTIYKVCKKFHNFNKISTDRKTRLDTEAQNIEIKFSDGKSLKSFVQYICFFKWDLYNQTFLIIGVRSSTSYKRSPKYLKEA